MNNHSLLKENTGLKRDPNDYPTFPASFFVSKD